MAEPTEIKAEKTSDRSWLRSAEVWTIIGGAGALVTAITAVAAVFVALDQLQEARALQIVDSTYVSWNQLNTATLANPDLACPASAVAFQKIMADPASNARYAAYGYMLYTTSDQILQMAPDDPHWRFLIRERMKCHAPAVRYLRNQGDYEKRYSCPLRQVIAEALDEAPPSCPKDAN